MQDLKQKTVRGGFAKLCAQAATLALRLGSLVVLARLLNPEDFGLVAMVTAVTGVLNLFRDFGLSTVTVQRTTLTEDQISTLFWINLLIGSVLTCIVLASAPFIAAFYSEPRLLWITVALAVSFLFNAAGVQHLAIVQRQMRFATLAAIEILSLLVSVAVGVGMAVLGFGYWALVGMAVSSPLAYSILAWLAAKWTPGRPRRRIGILAMVRFGGTVTLNGLVVYVAYNFEKVLLGRFWGADALGIYGRAYQLINISTDSLNSATGQVALSALSRIKDDPDRLKNYFLKGYSLVVALTLPITITCLLFADDLILIVLGSKWSEVTPIFRLLAPTTLVYALINPFSWLLFALGLVGRSLKIALVLAPLVIAGYVAGLPYGPQGVALAYSTVLALWVIPHLAWCVHGTNISLKDIMVVLSRPVLSVIVAGMLAWGVIAFCGDSFSHLARLVLGSTVLLTAYIGLLFYVMKQKALYLGLVSDLFKAPAPERGRGVGMT